MLQAIKLRFVHFSSSLLTQNSPICANASTQPDGPNVNSLPTHRKVFNSRIDQDSAQQIVDGAHLECPYSKATHGNINVVTNIVDTAKVQSM
jgi:organic hydroperoxide reductase OsmC/OhrA